MGKRSNFERRERDFYPTIDRRSVAALSRVIGHNILYIEPCAGDGSLVELLELEHQKCLWSGDIEPRAKWIKEADALDLVNQCQVLNLANCIITNPPFTRPVMHSMIEYFSTLKPTWLLMEADWIFTKQSAPYMNELCTDIIAVGRLRWIPDTKTDGKDNFMWARFDVNKKGLTKFHGRVDA